MNAVSHPLDPDCIVVIDAVLLRDNPFVRVGHRVWADFEREHRLICERCQRYGAANVEEKPIN